MSDEPRIAVAYDWLQAWRGGETVLAAILRLYPRADLFALVDFLPDALRARIGGKRARTTFVQNLPGARRYFRWMLPLFPRAIESLDVSRYDIVISVSHAVAKGVRTRNDQLHICYCNTPMRYAWDLRDQYLRERRPRHGLEGKARARDARPPARMGPAHERSRDALHRQLRASCASASRAATAATPT